MSVAEVYQASTEKFGDLVAAESGRPDIRLSPAAWREVKRSGVYALGDLYGQGEWAPHKLDEVMYDYFTSRAAHEFGGRWGLLWSGVLKNKLSNPQYGLGAFKIGRFHYDLGNDLFRAMLDSSMSYTCGVWQGVDSLEAAQQQKLERICERLQLKQGMRVADIGCGWGNFAKFAAEHYGVSVVGVTVSKEQAEHARILTAGLPVEIRLSDYRELSGSFDRVVSIEMIEAVGRKNLPVFFKTCHRLLKDKGLFVLQVISADTASKTSLLALDQFLAWILKYIFPDGYLPRPHELLAVPSGLFTVKEMESYQGDYDKTLMAWQENFERAWPSLQRSYGDPFRRRWNFYLQTCAAVFRAGLVDVHQVVYRKAGGAR